MILRSRYFLLYFVSALLLGIPSYLTWFRDPFVVTRFEYDYFLGWLPGQNEPVDFDVLMIGKVIHATVILIMSWGYYRLIVTLANQAAFSWGQIITASVLMMGVTFCYVPWLSPDVFFYFGTGWLDSNYHLNPYQHTISEIPGYESNPLFENIIEPWKHIITPYGPLFVWFVGWVTQLARGNDLACLLIIKVFFVLFHLLNGWLVYLVSEQLNVKAKLAAVVYLLNPVPLLAYIGWGHNDIMMMTCILVAVWAMLRDRHILATAFLGLGVGLKYFPLLLFPYFVIYMMKGRRLVTAVLAAAGLTLFFAFVVLVPYFWYENGVHNFVRLFRGQDQLYRNLLYWLPLIFIPDPDLGSAQIVKLVLKAIFLAIYAVIAWLLRQKGAKLTPGGVFAGIILWMLAYFTIGSPELHEWYIGWFLCFVFWVDDLSYFNVGMFLTVAFNPLVIFEVKAPTPVLRACWQICFLVFWLCLYYLYRRKLVEHAPSPLFFDGKQGPGEGKPELIT
jgi:hypothetical protein